PSVPLGLPSWERTLRAVEKVRNRLLRATAALDKAGVAYAVAGGNAVAAWVGKVDQAAVRFTQDVDLLIRRHDLDKARAAVETAAFAYRHPAAAAWSPAGPLATARAAVHIPSPGQHFRR